MPEGQIGWADGVAHHFVQNGDRSTGLEPTVNVQSGVDRFLAHVISLLLLLCVLSFTPSAGSIFTRMLVPLAPLALILVMMTAVLFTGAGILLDMEGGVRATT